MANAKRTVSYSCASGTPIRDLSASGARKPVRTSASGRKSPAAKAPAARKNPAPARTQSRPGAAPRMAQPATRPQAGRKKAASKKRRRLKNPRKLLRLLPMLLLPALLIAMIFVIRSGDTRTASPAAAGAEESGLFSGLSALAKSLGGEGGTAGGEGAVVEGISLAGLSREQATAQLKPAATSLLASIDLLLKEGDTELRMTSAYIGAETDMEALLERIYVGGADGDFQLTVSADEALIKERLGEIASELGDPPVEPYASVRLNENNVQRFEIHEGQNGTVLDVEATTAAIQAALAARNFQAHIAPVMKDTAPEMSAAFIEANTERIATYTTRFRESKSQEIIANRVFNITKAAELINCTTVEPGEEWSFNDHVGLRTVDGGWKEANGITGGKEYSLQAGGGICQVSTTLYNALLRGNIEVTDRKAHSIPSDYVDKGLDATVDSGGIDLKFVNDTGAPLYIFAYIKPDGDRYCTITVSLYGKPLPEGTSYECRSEVIETNERTDTRFSYSDSIPEGYELTTVQRHDGYTAEVYRDKIVDGEVVDSTLLYTDKYRGNVAEVTIGTGDPETTEIPEGAEKAKQVEGEVG